MKVMKISPLAIAQRHPRGLFCKTDRMYAEAADFIYIRLKKQILGLLDENSIKRVSISCALFLEDYFSETHQMAVFMQWHKNKFGSFLPFYADFTDEADALKKQFQFVLWHAICAERPSNIINPENEGLVVTTYRIVSDLAASRLWDRMDSEPNEELTEYLYCEETQSDIMEIKNVLKWIQRYSFFGYWYDLPGDDAVAKSIDTMFPNLDDSKRTYAIDSISAYGLQTWPCSLKAQEIYASMIRFDMDDDNDPYAKDIEDIEYKGLSIYRIVDSSDESFMIEDFDGTRFPVTRDSFSERTGDGYKQIVSSFVKFGGVYSCNGISSWYDFPDEEYEKYRKTREEEHSMMHKEGQFDEFIQKNKGRRVFFFNNFMEYTAWIEKDLGLKGDMPSLPDKSMKNDPLMIFFEPNGQMTLTYEVEGICSPLNPAYDKKKAPNKALGLLLSTSSASPDCIHYLLEQGLLSDAAFNHIKGAEAGHALVQNNVELLTRCFRRDIRW